MSNNVRCILNVLPVRYASLPD
ncbi:hypothetical protein BDI4_10038 [Burkholderia diffusa]|nr:hypothetical protein BDI4_10038 [Burkholderia diffusa]